MNVINPASVFLGVSTNLVIDGNFFTTVDSNQYQCQFSAAGNPAQVFANVTAQFGSENSLSCLNPIFTSSGVSTLAILYKFVSVIVRLRLLGARTIPPTSWKCLHMIVLDLFVDHVCRP